MNEWLQTSVVVAASIAVLLAFVFLWRFCSPSRQERDLREPDKDNRAETLQSGIAKLHHLSLHHQLDLDTRRRANYYMFRREISSKPLFSWADHPSLVTDAVENGWSRFAFANSFTSSPSVRSSARSTLLGSCGAAAGDRGREMEVEISWEVCQGSADFMQKIRLNSGLKRINWSNSSTFASSVIKTALPLPGPPLGNSSFPQEAYFEITILSSEEEDRDPFGTTRRKIRSEGEKAKLIQENSKGKGSYESLVHVRSSHGSRKLEELKLGGGEDESGKEGIKLTLGLTRGGSLPLKLPGSYPASIGFNSDGSVFLDGIKLVFEAGKEDWGRKEKVIGCGYNPSQRKVFFTVDSQLLHVINCKSEEFGTPLYPTLAANIDIKVLVNFGQSVFKYAPADAQRTPNPCFIGPLVNSPVLGYEDSKELFSMGRIDAQWLNRSTTRSVHNNAATANNKTLEFDDESEGDLFEIVLDGREKSPNTVLQ